MSDGWSDPQFERIAQLVAARTGVVSTRSHDDFERATRRAMAKLSITGLAAFAACLSADRGWNELVDEITVGETYFFRNPEHFELLRDTMLPAILRERGNRHRLKLWSAGCASGEEAYSLAIMLHEMGLLDQSSIQGTDISPQAVAKAQAARYRDWAFRGLDPGRIARYFETVRGERVLRREIRDHVKFQLLNFASDAYPSQANDTLDTDFIFCRNVLIYFDDKTIAHVERQLFASLAPGGWLITGPSDPMFGRAAPFEVTAGARGICYRRPLGRAANRAINISTLPEINLPMLAPEWQPLMRAQRVRTVPPPAIEARPTQVALAIAAFERADYLRVIELARMLPDHHDLAVLAVRAIWNCGDAARTQRACASAIESHGLSAELHYLHAVALLDARNFPQALAAVRRALYLDRSLVIAHFTHGSILERMHDLEGARRAYRNAHEAAAAHAPEQALPLADGIAAKGLAAAATRALAELDRRRVG